MKLMLVESDWRYCHHFYNWQFTDTFVILL